MKQLPLVSANSVQGTYNLVFSARQSAFIVLYTDVVDLVKRYIDAHPTVCDDRSRWVEDMGWDPTKW